MLSGDKAQDGWNESMKECPWVAIPFNENTASDAAKKLAELVPCTGYPTPGVISGKTFAVIDPDCFGKVDQANYDDWLSKKDLEPPKIEEPTAEEPTAEEPTTEQ